MFDWWASLQTVQQWRKNDKVVLGFDAVLVKIHFHANSFRTFSCLISPWNALSFDQYFQVVFESGETCDYNNNGCFYTGT